MEEKVIRPSDPNAELKEDELAALWRVSLPTLRVWRHRKKGPSYYKIGGSVRYRMRDIIDFEEKNKITIPCSS